MINLKDYELRFVNCNVGDGSSMNLLEDFKNKEFNCIKDMIDYVLDHVNMQIMVATVTTKEIERSCSDDDDFKIIREEVTVEELLKIFNDTAEIIVIAERDCDCDYCIYLRAVKL